MKRLIALLGALFMAFSFDKPVVDTCQSYPVGSVYINAVDDADPSNILGCGEWEKFGEGRAMIGDGEEKKLTGRIAGDTGGTESHTLTISEMPSHTHDVSATLLATQLPAEQPTPYNGELVLNAGNRNYRTTDPTTSMHPGSIVVSEGAAGDGQPHNNMMPYIVVYMWVRVN